MLKAGAKSVFYLQVHDDHLDSLARPAYVGKPDYRIESAEEFAVVLAKSAGQALGVRPGPVVVSVADKAWPTKTPIIEIAKGLGNVKAANIVALSAFVTRSKVVQFDSLKSAVKDKFALKEKLIPLNMKALEEGRKAALAR